MKISLYQCSDARVKDKTIYCAKGHLFGSKKDGTVELKHLIRGEPLGFAACQRCKNYDEMGGPIDEFDRG